MTKPNEVHMDEKVICDICKIDVASADGKTKMGPWAYMCEKCFTKHGVGLGIGKGQKLIYPTPNTKEKEMKVELDKILNKADHDIKYFIETTQYGEKIKPRLDKVTDAIFDLQHYMENGDDEENYTITDDDLTPNEYAAKLYSR